MRVALLSACVVFSFSFLIFLGIVAPFSVTLLLGSETLGAVGIKGPVLQVPWPALHEGISRTSSRSLSHKLPVPPLAARGGAPHLCWSLNSFSAVPSQPTFLERDRATQV